MSYEIQAKYGDGSIVKFKNAPGNSAEDAKDRFLAKEPITSGLMQVTVVTRG